MDNEFGMQELYFVQLKSTYPMEINGKEFAAGEVVASFDKIQLANFKEIQKEVAARGGYENRKLIVWRRTEGVNLTFVQGIFSQIQFGMMNNTKMIEVKEDEVVKIAQRDILETNENGDVELTHIPADDWIFVYNKETGEKLTGLERTAEKTLHTPLVYTDVVIDYEYEYDNGAHVSIVGQEFMDYYFTLEARTRVKDDVTGDTHTAIIYIPKLKITSDFELHLGENAPPMVGRFIGEALPVGNGRDTKVLEICFLDDDIDADSEWR